VPKNGYQHSINHQYTCDEQSRIMKKDYILDLMRSKKTVFTFKDLILFWGESDVNFVKKKIHRYVKAGKMNSISRGIYSKDKNYDKYELATKIYTPSYISMETALGAAGITFQLYSQIFVASYTTVDLDFDLLNLEKENHVFEQVKTILENYGKLKQVRKKRFNLFYVLSYDGKDINAQNIKVEINRREFGSKYSIESFLGISMQVMVKEDMAAHKLCAMYERIGKTNRDIFDVYFFLSHDWPVNKKIIKNRMCVSYTEFLKKCIDIMEKFNDNNILSGIGKFLSEKQKTWVKTKLKSEVLFLLRLALEKEK